ncbi:MAG: NAD(P)-dependent oxidoreductase [Anaerolineales bacterium]|nr:NAD(P)-dependent oxidoreductase [Anaerolineales bacterium]
MRIGYIGLGNMGGPMAINLARAGCDLTVYDLDPDKIARVAAAGAQAGADGPAVAAQSDLLFTSFPEPRHVAAAVPALIDALPAGAVWVDLTTDDRDLVLRLADQAAARGVSVLEAPVTGAVDGARLGRLTFFVGGEPAVIERVRPYFQIMGKVVVCGALGTGNVVKLITNQIWFINAAAVGEGLVLGKKAGVDLLVLWEALKNSVGDTWVVRHDVPSIFAGHYDPSFTLDLCCKDLRLLKQLSEQTGTQMDLTLAARDKFEAARTTFGGGAAELLVCKLVEDASGTDLRVAGQWTKPWEA